MAIICGLRGLRAVTWRREGNVFRRFRYEFEDEKRAGQGEKRRKIFLLYTPFKGAGANVDGDDHWMQFAAPVEAAAHPAVCSAPSVSELENRLWKGWRISREKLSSATGYSIGQIWNAFHITAEAKGAGGGKTAAGGYAGGYTKGKNGKRGEEWGKGKGKSRKGTDERAKGKGGAGKDGVMAPPGRKRLSAAEKRTALQRFLTTGRGRFWVPGETVADYSKMLRDDEGIQVNMIKTWSDFVFSEWLMHAYVQNKAKREATAATAAAAAAFSLDKVVDAGGTAGAEEGSQLGSQSQGVDEDGGGAEEDHTSPGFGAYTAEEWNQWEQSVWADPSKWGEKLEGGGVEEWEQKQEQKMKGKVKNTNRGRKGQ